MTTRAAIAFACGLVGSAATVDAQPAREQPRPMALGFNLDLLPTVASAANGEAGYAPQVWLGIDRVRLRLVGAHLEPPDAFAFADEGFTHPTITAFAAIIDYTFGDDFDGAWVGAGFELWDSTIEHDGVDGVAQWRSTVFTIGGGYIYRFAGNFFVDPWLGLHGILDPETVTLGTYEYSPLPIQAEVSVKVGWFVVL